MYTHRELKIAHLIQKILKGENLEQAGERSIRFRHIWQCVHQHMEPQHVLSLTHTSAFEEFFDDTRHLCDKV